MHVSGSSSREDLSNSPDEGQAPSGERRGSKGRLSRGLRRLSFNRSSMRSDSSASIRSSVSSVRSSVTAVRTEIPTAEITADLHEHLEATRERIRYLEKSIPSLEWRQKMMGSPTPGSGSSRPQSPPLSPRDQELHEAVIRIPELADPLRPRPAAHRRNYSQPSIEL